MDLSRPGAALPFPAALATISLQDFAGLPMPLLAIQKPGQIVWLNQLAAGLYPRGRLSELLSQPAVVSGIAAAFSGDGAATIDDAHNLVRLHLIQVLANDFLLASVEDLQQRQRLDEEYRRLQKSGSLFLFSQGLGHDLKDRLTGVLGNLNLARVIIEDGRPGAEALDNLHDAERATLEADSLVQQFMLFSHNDNETTQGLDLPALIGNAAALTLGGSSRKMQISMREPIWKLNGNPGQIQQVFQNILQNAAEAMPGPGTIHVDMENLRIQNQPDSQDSEGSKLRDGQMGPGDFVAIHIRDTGEGILARDLPFIFEPFFSRKELRQGLGLTVALSIIRKHRGFIDIHSQSGRGTTVSIYLPISEAMENPVRLERSSKPAKILVMDDESLVREVWERMLTRLGHRGSFVAEGAEAVYLFQTALHSDHPFDMVILDLTVPGGMGARETLESLKALDPQVKAVICSGYTQDPLMQSYLECGFKAALAKPFGLDNLQRLVQDVLA